MATRKKKNRPSARLPVRLRQLIALVRGPGRPAALAVLFLSVFLGGWYWLWCFGGVGGQVLSLDGYRLTSGDVEITPLPQWIHTDIRAEVFRDASLDGPLSIMDAELTERISAAFSLHPWIAEVRRVRKYHPARVKVELVYRRPVCMVEVPGGLLPVDHRGVLLPCGDFSPIEASRRYPRLVGIGTVPVGPAGERWGDERVTAGAEIAELFGAAWHELKLDRIVPSEPAQTHSGREITYELFTRSGTRVIWGRAPATDMPGEPAAVEKVARLQKYARKYGTLDGPRGPQKLDLTSPESLRVSQRKSASRLQ